MARYRVIRKYVEHYEHIVEADSQFEAGDKAIEEVLQGYIGKELSGDTYVEDVYLIKEGE